MLCQKSSMLHPGGAEGIQCLRKRGAACFRKGVAAMVVGRPKKHSATIWTRDCMSPFPVCRIPLSVLSLHLQECFILLITWFSLTLRKFNYSWLLLYMPTSRSSIILWCLPLLFIQYHSCPLGECPAIWMSCQVKHKSSIIFHFSLEGTKSPHITQLYCQRPQYWYLF